MLSLFYAIKRDQIAILNYLSYRLQSHQKFEVKIIVRTLRCKIYIEMANIGTGAENYTGCTK